MTYVRFEKSPPAHVHDEPRPACHLVPI